MAPGRKLMAIRSRKHPGAIFLRYADTVDDFVAKFYPGHEAEAMRFKQLFEQDEWLRETRNNAGPLDPEKGDPRDTSIGGFRIIRDR